MLPLRLLSLRPVLLRQWSTLWLSRVCISSLCPRVASSCCYLTMLRWLVLLLLGMLLMLLLVLVLLMLRKRSRVLRNTSVLRMLWLMLWLLHLWHLLLLRRLMGVSHLVLKMRWKCTFWLLMLHLVGDMLHLRRSVLHLGSFGLRRWCWRLMDLLQLWRRCWWLPLGHWLWLP